MRIYYFEIAIVVAIIKPWLPSFAQAFAVSPKSSCANSRVAFRSIPPAVTAVPSTISVTHFRLLQFKPIAVVVAVVVVIVAVVVVIMAELIIIAVYELFWLILINVIDFTIIIVILRVFSVTSANVLDAFRVPAVSAVLITTVIAAIAVWVIISTLLPLFSVTAAVILIVVWEDSIIITIIAVAFC